MWILRKDIGEYLKQKRREHGLTQEKLAQEFEITNPYISQIETGKSSPSDSILQKYIKRFNIPVSEIYSIPTSITIGTELRSLRMGSGLDVARLEELTGVEFSRIVSFEMGETIPTEDELRRICQAFNVADTYFEDNETKLTNSLIEILRKLGLNQYHIDNMLGYIKKYTQK